MNSVLRIAFAFFTVVPLQRWVGGFGLLLLTMAAAVLALRRNTSAVEVMPLVLIGLVLIALVPVWLGGAAMRIASTKSLLHLRPHGRARLLLGSTLAITLLAVLGTLPALLLDWFPSPVGRRGPNLLPPLDTLQLGWSAVALSWVCMFALSRSMMALSLVGLLPVIAVSGGRFIAPLFPGIGWFFAFGVAAWAFFCIWYLRVDSIHRTKFPSMDGTGAGWDSPVMARLTALGASRQEITARQALYHHLFGCASPLFFVITGAWITAIFVLASGFGDTRRSVTFADRLLGMLPFLSFFTATLGYSTSRRARYVWLRAGMDRPTLFALLERWALRSALLTWAAPALLAFTAALVQRPELALFHGLFLLQQASVAVALFYAGGGLIRGWTAGDVILCIVVVILFLAEAIVVLPLRETSVATMAILLAGGAAVAFLLRWNTQRHWRRVDWRVARPSQFGMSR